MLNFAQSGFLGKGNNVNYFFVSGAGSGDGKSAANPMSISSFLSATIPGNSEIRFNKGETFDLGEITATADNILYSSYGSGANPILRGSVDVGAQSWTNEGSGIWSTICAQVPKWVFVNGVAAHYAESSWINVTARPSTTQITVSAAIINALPSSVVGAKMRMKEFNFRMSSEYTITAYNSGTGVLTISPATTSTAYGGVNMPLKLMTQLQFVTANGDWFYDSGTTKLYYKAASSPSGTDIRICVHDESISVIGKKNVSFQGLNFVQYYKNAIRIESSYGSGITGCTIDQIRNDGIYIHGDSAAALITFNDIGNCGSNGILSGVGDHYSIDDNVIHDIGMQSNYNFPIRLSLVGGNAFVTTQDEATTVYNTPSDISFRRNHCYNLSYCGTNLTGPNHIIESNKIHDCGLRFNDGGAIYGIYRNTLDLHTSNWSIKNNIVYNCTGSVEGISGGPTIEFQGVYMDNGCNLNTIDGNTIYTATSVGILLNFDTEQNTIINNNVWNCASMIKFRQNSSSSPVFANNTKNVFTGNKLLCKNNSQVCVLVFDDSAGSYDPFASGGDSNNNHYVNGYGTGVCTQQSSSKTLAQWQTLFGYDGSSTSFTNFQPGTGSTHETDVQTNWTSSSVSFTPPDGWWDIYGVVQSSVTIPAYSSYLYVRKSPVIYVNAGNFVTATAVNASLTPNYPASLVSGDLLLLFVGTRSGPLPISTDPPTGWTKLYDDTNASTVKSYVYYKISDGTESGNVTVTFSGGTNVPRMARIFQFRNIAPPTFVDGADYQAATGTTTVTAPTITTTGYNELAVSFQVINVSVTMGTFTGMTGGTWFEPVGEWTISTNGGLTMQIQWARMPDPVTITGGSITVGTSGFPSSRGFGLKRAV